MVKKASTQKHKYVVATPRELRGKVPTVLARLSQKSGLKVVGSANPDRIVIVAANKAIRELGAEFGDQLLIEPELTYSRQD
jgi:hypothetical protein